MPKNFSEQTEYNKGFGLNELFIVSSSGVETQNDGELIAWKPFKTNYNQEILYRPFDTRFINYDETKVARTRKKIMQHMFSDNIGLLAKRGFDEYRSTPIFLSSKMVDRRVWTRPGMQGAEVLYPLYLYHDHFGKTEKTANLNEKIVSKIADQVRNDDAITPENIFDYIYAVLHSPNYRETYKEFLKIDFPRVPYPTDQAQFWKLVSLGERLRKIHLLESDEIDTKAILFPKSGSNEVEIVSFAEGKVWINKEQYFDGVSRVAWEFYIGGYQPAQKWLKDRKARSLGYEDIEHYRQIISALTLTDKIMQEILQLHSV
ncbi:hypothetical protein AGMMS50229_18520 [Campylobacterota bacterium]|nr:hypothetical protein AGMMS50229_18520 [Campylobacterota bacterium]